MNEDTTKVAQSRADKLISIRKQREELDRLERTTGSSGAVPLGPKAAMLASDLPEKNPDKHYRWVNVKNPEKAMGRIAEGFTKVAEGEGGRNLGGLALFEIPRSKYDERIARQDKLAKDRLNMHKDQAHQMAESLSRELRDKHGIKVDPRRLLEIEGE